MVRVIRLKPVEEIPHAVALNSHPLVLACLLLFAVPLLLVLGYASAMPLSALVAGWSGAFATAGIVILRPINLFGYWRDYRQFTPGERRAITFLRSRTARIKILGLGLFTGSLPATGGLWGWLAEERNLLAESQLLSLPVESWVSPWLQIHAFEALCCGFLFVVLYYPVMSLYLRRRWTWIQQTQTPADREVVERQYQAVTERWLKPVYRRYFGLNHD